VGFSRASSVLAVRVGEGGRDRGGVLAGYVAGDSSRCRRSRFSHVSKSEHSESARLCFGIDYNLIAGGAGFMCACGGGRGGRGVVVSHCCVVSNCCCRDSHVTALGSTRLLLANTTTKPIACRTQTPPHKIELLPQQGNYISPEIVDKRIARWEIYYPSPIGSCIRYLPFPSTIYLKSKGTPLALVHRPCFPVMFPILRFLPHLSLTSISAPRWLPSFPVYCTSECVAATSSAPRMSWLSAEMVMLSRRGVDAVLPFLKKQLEHACRLIRGSEATGHMSRV
jgi:hypothetical protein